MADSTLTPGTKAIPTSKERAEHELKIASEFFDAVDSGRKPFEIRKGDRPFKIGDTLWLREVDITLAHTGREMRKRITFCLRGWGMESGYVALGLAPHGFETSEPRAPSGHVGGCMCSPCREWRLVQHANTLKAGASQVGCERDDGLLNVHPETEVCEVCRPKATPPTPVMQARFCDYKGPLVERDGKMVCPECGNS